MKLAVLAVIFSSCCYCIVLVNSTTVSSPELIAAIIDEYYHARQTPLLVAYNSSELKLVNQVLGSLSIPRTVQLNNVFLPGYKSWYYAIFFLNNLDSFELYVKQLRSDYFNLHGYYTFVYNDLAESQITNMFNALWELKILKALIISLHEDQPQLYSYSPYTSSKCGTPDVFRVDRATSSLLFKPQLDNFYGCALRVGTFESLPFIHFPPSPEKQSSIEGFEGHLVTTIANKLRFKLEFVNPPDGAQWGVVRPNNGSTGLMGLLQKSEVHFGIGCLAIIADRDEILTRGTPHYTTSVVFGVPDGRRYSAFEKLFQPFDFYSWFVVFTIHGFAAVVILVLKFCPEPVRQFVYGDGNRIAFFNTVQIFYSGLTSHVPKRNFARTLLLLFLGYAFLIRSMYQGLMFKYLQADSKHKPVETVDELERSDLRYDMLLISERFFKNNPAILKRARRIHTGNDSLNAALDGIATKKNQDGAVLVTSQHIAFHNKYRLDKGFVRSTRDQLVTSPVVFYYPRKSFLVLEFNRIIGVVQTAGLMSYWVQKYGNYDFFPKEIREVRPTIMNIRSLLGCYEVCAFMTVSSILMFLIELASQKVPVLRKAIEFFADK